MRLVDRSELLSEKIRDDPPSSDVIRAARVLVEYYAGIHGFMAGHVAEAFAILREARKKCKLRFLSFPANIVSTGLRGLITKLLRDGHFNVVITTCGTIDHDIAKALTDNGYYKGVFDADDSFLEEQEIHRLGNVFIPVENYGPTIERFVSELIEKISSSGSTRVAGYELLWKAGEMIKDTNSILRAAWERKIPLIVPGFYDGSFGTNVYIYSRIKSLTIDLALDQKLLDDLVFENTNEKSMALIIGGGISKHHTIWWNQFKGGLDYVVYVTTAVEYDGSLSGARPKEAISWGKVKRHAKQTVVYGDATIILPLICSAFYEE